jgi:hypothetical protein
MDACSSCKAFPNPESVLLVNKYSNQIDSTQIKSYQVVASQSKSNQVKASHELDIVQIEKEMK